MNDHATTSDSDSPAGFDPREMLRLYLHDRDVGCPSCGYNLREQRNDICPECGEQFRLHLQLAEPKQAAMLAGMVALAGGLGFNILLLIYISIIYLRFPMASWMNIFVAETGGGAVIFGAGVFFWLRYWKAIRRLPYRWMLVSISYLLVLADILLFSFTIR